MTALGDTVSVGWNSATNVPITANGYNASGNTIEFALNFVPETGTELMVVKNTGLPFINGTFDNLSQGQSVSLIYGGVTYRFVANYYGGTGNDLVLVWGSNRVFAWGGNTSGQLGDGTTSNRVLTVPVTATGVLAGKTVMAVQAGYMHSLALCSDGTVAGWGTNYLGQLGDNTTNSSGVPVAVNAANGISALYGKTVVAIAAGGYHSLALCSDGTVAAWGGNSNGQLGDNTLTRRAAPVTVNEVSGVSALYGKSVAAIAAGGNHSMALCTDGTVAAWGLNLNGQLGDKTITSRLIPVFVNTDSDVSALFGKSVLAVAAGAYHSLALCTDGTVAAWGNNINGQLGINSGLLRCTTPAAVSTSSGVSVLYAKTVVSIAAGGAHCLALCSDGNLAAWGNNSSGQLGDNATLDRGVPVAVNTVSNVSALCGKTVVGIAAGTFHSVGICCDGTVAAWGDNSRGQLGDNTTTQRKVPVAVSTTPLVPTQRFMRLAPGSVANHALAMVGAPPACDVTLVNAQTLTNGSFQGTFTNTPGAFFGVLATTNPALPLSNWSSLTGLTELSTGQFQFTDPEATNISQRFYRVHSP